MANHIRKEHNKSLLFYHLVCPIRYRRAILGESAVTSLRDVCEEMQQRYEIQFLEIGSDGDHVHFLIQSVPTYAPRHIAQTVKSLTARELFRTHPEIKKFLWGGKLWTSGYYDKVTPHTPTK